MRKLVLTGGPYSGKSTLLKTFQDEGYYFVHEAAIDMIEDLNAQLGVEESIRWRLENWSEFQGLILQEQKRREAQIPAGLGWAIIDRGQPDCVAFCKLLNKDISKAAQEAFEQVTYDLVIILDIIRPFNPRRETGRIESEADAIRVTDLLEDTYRQTASRTIRLPNSSVEERLATIKSLMRDVSLA